jgi:hypothetical protein
MEISKNSLMPSVEDQKEKEGKIDFVSTYKARLADAVAVPQQEQESLAFNYRETKLKKVKYVMPAAIFLWDNEGQEEYHLWILPENNPASRVYHDKIDADLFERLGEKRDDMILGPFSAHILIGMPEDEDAGEETYLAIHESFARAVESDRDGQSNEEFVRKWGSFMERYDIGNIMGNFKETLPVGKQSKRNAPREILSVDIIEQILENKELLKIAKMNHLTNYQMIRMFMEFYAAKNTNRSFDCRTYAEKLSKEPRIHPYESSE